jgi:hypothetical protein
VDVKETLARRVHVFWDMSLAPSGIHSPVAGADSSREDCDVASTTILAESV